MFAISWEDLVDLSIVQRVLEILILYVIVEVVIELRVIDGVYINMVMDSGKRFFKEGVMLLGVWHGWSKDPLTDHRTQR